MRFISLNVDYLKIDDLTSARLPPETPRRMVVALIRNII